MKKVTEADRLMSIRDALDKALRIHVSSSVQRLAAFEVACIAVGRAYRLGRADERDSGQQVLPGYER